MGLFQDRYLRELAHASATAMVAELQYSAVTTKVLGDIVGKYGNLDTENQCKELAKKDNVAAAEYARAILDVTSSLKSVALFSSILSGYAMRVPELTDSVRKLVASTDALGSDFMKSGASDRLSFIEGTMKLAGEVIQS